MFIPNSNDTMQVEDLVKLNESLRKSGTVGYQDPSVPSAGDSLSPLVPQSIEQTLASATYGMSELSLWNMIPKQNVANTLHEYVVVNEHGFDLDPFIGEGGGGENDFVTNASQYEKKSIRIKYMAERRQISDVAALVGLVGDNRSALAEETLRGTMNLMRKVERQLWYGREDLNSKGFDGLFKQMEDNAPSNVFDLDGKTPTPLLLQEALGEVYSAPNYGRPDTIYVEPRMHSELIKQSVESGRHDQFMVSQASNGLTFGSKDLKIMAPYGEVSIKPATFLHYASRLPASGFGNVSVRPAAPAFSVQPAAAANAGSKFAAADEGAYKFAVVAMNERGMADPVFSDPVNVSQGEGVSFTLAAAADALYYRVYRTSANGADSSMLLIKEIPAARSAAGAALATVIEDLNDGADGQKYGCSPIFFAQHDPQVMQFVRLLDFLRRPLAETASVKPFLLMLFGSPIIKTPNKLFMMKNAGISSVGNFVQ